MQLPDENVDYHFQRLMAQPPEAWTPLAELQAIHYILPERLEALKAVASGVRSQIAAERELANPPAKLLPLEPGFIDLPLKLLEGYRRKQDQSELGKILRIANRLREDVDRVVVLGIGNSYLAAQALFESLCHTYHNEMPAKLRIGKPRMYFEGNNLDNDALQDLLELLENTCVDPELTEERWGIVVISKAGGALETAAAFRALRNEAAKYYGLKSELFRSLVVPITGSKSWLRDMALRDGYTEDEILSIPDDVGSRFAVFTPVGLLPAAILGLDVRAMLLGAASMTKRFLEEPFERNPVLQYAAVSYLMCEELKKPVRVMAVWSRKLEALGRWYDHLLAESLGKFGRGATPLTVVNTRDLHGRGHQHQEGVRDKLINNLIVRSCRQAPVPIGMSDRNEDELNAISRRNYPDLMEVAVRSTNEALAQCARPSADIILPTLSEHTIGQLMQMLMLATVVEARLMNVNPYGQNSQEAYTQNMMRILRSIPNLPRGEVRDAAKGV